MSVQETMMKAELVSMRCSSLRGLGQGRVEESSPCNCRHVKPSTAVSNDSRVQERSIRQKCAGMHKEIIDARCETSFLIVSAWSMVDWKGSVRPRSRPPFVFRAQAADWKKGLALKQKILPRPFTQA
ncbi:hypothetical protein L1887_48036 [Cichorium endivia]|nr:hypothetical protein L1887_48036 [Cichorium endivia]